MCWSIEPSDVLALAQHERDASLWCAQTHLLPDWSLPTQPQGFAQTPWRPSARHHGEYSMERPSILKGLSWWRADLRNCASIAISLLCWVVLASLVNAFHSASSAHTLHPILDVVALIVRLYSGSLGQSHARDLLLDDHTNLQDSVSRIFCLNESTF